jgi:hypothetical protein
MKSHGLIWSINVAVDVLVSLGVVSFNFEDAEKKEGTRED